MERSNNFDTLRLVAAGSVIFSHAFLLSQGRQDNEPLVLLTGGQSVLGVVGVFVFFVISGFLVTQSFETTGSPLRFLAKRALRIYPGLAACILLCAFVLGPLVTSLPLGAYLRSAGVYDFLLNKVPGASERDVVDGTPRFEGRFVAGAVVHGIGGRDDPDPGRQIRIMMQHQVQRIAIERPDVDIAGENGFDDTARRE